MKKNLRDLLEHEIKDLYSAERQLIEALPKCAKAAKSESLKTAFQEHLEETKMQKERLQKAADLLAFDPSGETCVAMEGLVKEAQKVIDMEADDDVRDAALIAAAQRVEHYEISGYGTARHFARMLEETEVADLLEETLEEESDADERLNDLAIEKINEKAMA